MDWKAFYEDERAIPENREQIDAWLRETVDRSLVARIQRSEILSFPHTALRYAGRIQARVVRALYASGVKRVIALGVLHGTAGLAARTDSPAAPSEAQRARVRRVTGAFLPDAGELHAGFGRLLVGRSMEPVDGALRVDRDGVLDSEFSLDTFLALVRRAASLASIPPLDVLPVYVGLTRDPTTGSYVVAERLAQILGSLRDDRTAIVTTGDLVHYGTAYGSDLSAGSMPPDRTAWAAHFRDAVDDALHDGGTHANRDAFHRRSLHELLNDQREILPVIGALFGGTVRHRILSFALSDYSEIFSAPPPCLVASALVAYGPRAHAD